MTGIVRWIAPYFGVLFFVMHVAAALGRAGFELKDPGVGWHLVAGRLVLERGAIPRVDEFSFTAESRPWIDYYWLFQTVSAWLERAGGLPLVSIAWILAYALIPFLLYRWMVRRGASPLAIFLVLPLAHMVLLSHAYARPHVLTYVFFVLVVGRLDDVTARRRPVASLWWLPLLAALWANLHGGFVSGLAAVGLVAAATGVRWLAFRDRADRGVTLGLALCAAAMLVATLANPYGWDLHRQAVEHLGAESTARFREFKSPNFRGGLPAVRCFELMILAVVGLGALGRLRCTWPMLVLLLGTLHSALVSVRDMNLFAIVAAPVLAGGVTDLLREWRPELVRRWQGIADRQEAGGAWRVQIPVIAAVLVALAMAGRLPLLTSLDGLQLTRGAAEHIAARPETFARTFNVDSLGGALIHRLWPRHRVFVDDRTPVYGEAFLEQDYFTVLYGRSGWQDVLDRWGITAAIVPAEAPCARLLEASREWRVDYADERNVIFVRSG